MVRSGLYFLCPKCLSINEDAEIEVRSEYKEWWVIAPDVVTKGEINWADCADKEKIKSIPSSSFTMGYTSGCKCRVEGNPQDYIVEIDAESKIVKAVGKHWKENPKLVEFAEKIGFSVVSD